MTAQLVPFPVDREIAHVRQAARQLERKHGQAADRWWRTECNRLYGRLQAAGIEEAEIRKQVARFSAAVQAELQRHVGRAPGAA